jgi:hypothetical protein
MLILPKRYRAKPQFNPPGWRVLWSDPMNGAVRPEWDTYPDPGDPDYVNALRDAQTAGDAIEPWPEENAIRIRNRVWTATADDVAAYTRRNPLSEGDQFCVGGRLRLATWWSEYGESPFINDPAPLVYPPFIMRCQIYVTGTQWATATPRGFKSAVWTHMYRNDWTFTEANTGLTAPHPALGRFTMHEHDLWEVWGSDWGEKAHESTHWWLKPGGGDKCRFDIDGSHRDGKSPWHYEDVVNSWINIALFIDSPNRIGGDYRIEFHVNGRRTKLFYFDHSAAKTWDIRGVVGDMTEAEIFELAKLGWHYPATPIINSTGIGGPNGATSLTGATTYFADVDPALDPAEDRSVFRNVQEIGDHGFMGVRNFQLLVPGGDPRLA